VSRRSNALATRSGFRAAGARCHQAPHSGPPADSLFLHALTQQALVTRCPPATTAGIQCKAAIDGQNRRCATCRDAMPGLASHPGRSVRGAVQGGAPAAGGCCLLAGAARLRILLACLPGAHHSGPIRAAACRRPAMWHAAAAAAAAATARSLLPAPHGGCPQAGAQPQVAQVLRSQAQLTRQLLQKAARLPLLRGRLSCVPACGAARVRGRGGCGGRVGAHNRAGRLSRGCQRA